MAGVPRPPLFPRPGGAWAATSGARDVYPYTPSPIGGVGGTGRSAVSGGCGALGDETPVKKKITKVPWRSSALYSQPRPGVCVDCRAQILVAQYSALPLALDPQPLTALGEIDALLHGARTWYRVGENLMRRSAFLMRNSVGYGGTIHRDHKCERGHPHGAAVKYDPPPDPNEKCPF